MKELTIDEVKAKQISILKEISEFCDIHKINYFLCGGTLIGAIRHGGYIPWDDDIDLMMPRPDYEKFKILFCRDGLKISATDNDPDYTLPFIKVYSNDTLIKNNHLLKGVNIGVNIDIFPIDGFPSGKICQHVKIIMLRFLIRSLKLKHTTYHKKGNAVLNITLHGVQQLLKLLKTKQIVNLINKIARKDDYVSSEYAGIAVWGYGKREICYKYWFVEKDKMEFEGSYYTVPGEAKKYLRTVYGDFMSLPPKEKRITNHDYIAYQK